MSDAIARIQDLIREADRRWFTEHPDATVHYRELMPGDFGPHTPAMFAEAREHGAEAMVEVVKLGEGVRAKRPYMVLPTPPKGGGR